MVLWLGSGCGRSVSEVVGPCNGSEDLCDRPYDQVAFATTHNSMSNSDDGWVKPNQHHGIKRQLEDGIRGLMLDLHYWEGFVMLCHYVCEMGGTYFGLKPIEEGLEEIGKFLDEHPGEVVTIIFESYVSAGDVEDAFNAAGLSKRLYVHKQGRSWPTLGSLIESGRRLVVFTDDDSGSPAWYHRRSVHCWETSYEVEGVQQFNCELKHGSMDNDLFLFNHFVTVPFSTEEAAAEANGFDLLYGRARDCWNETGRMPNFIAVDYYDLGDILTVVDQLNQ